MWNRNRSRIVSLVPAPDHSPEQVARLAGEPADGLADLVLDTRERWWRRRPCALALRGRVPASRAHALLDRVTDPKETTEVRRAILEVLSGDPSAPVATTLLVWLRATDERAQGYGMEEAMLAARAHLRDLDAAVRLAELAADPWTHRRESGEAALDALIAGAGLPALLAALGAADLPALAFAGRSPALRLLGVRLLHRTGGNISPALADDVIVARRAYELLAAGGAPEDPVLWALVEAGRADVTTCPEDHPPHGARGACIWALCVLARRGHDVRDVWRALGGPRVPLEHVPEDIRLAILAAYLPGQRETDPRWLLEAACTELPEPPDEAAHLARATGALARAGLAPQPPRSAGELHQQGDGTYHEIAFTGGSVSISLLGPFARFEGEAPAARDALVAAGFTIVDGGLGGLLFSGLHVYFFGQREPLTIHDLLFYWQD